MWSKRIERRGAAGGRGGLLFFALLVGALGAVACAPESTVSIVPVADDAPRVTLQTGMGTIVIGLYEEQAPVSTENFLSYVDGRFYDGTVFHRTMEGFMIQGGGFVRNDEGRLERKDTRPPIVNEAGNGLKNLRGTVALARTGDPNSATAQFFINTVDNQRLDRFGQVEVGYAVFGLVLEGMDVVDAIAAVETHLEPPSREPTVPVEDVVIVSARRQQ